jgi:hypothetical protein
MQPDDNILIARGTYTAGWAVPVAGVVAGLAGRWTVADPSPDTSPASDVFDFMSLPIIGGPNSADGGTIPAFRANALSSGTRLAFAGLRFENCSAAEPSFRSGGAILLQGPISIPVQVSCCSFRTNLANDFGGAIFLSSISDALVEFSQFEDNEVDCISYIPTYDRGMGGAIASFDSGLVVSNSSFSSNKAQVSSGSAAPPPGSAGGGGDAYVKNGSFKLFRSRSINAVAGFPRIAVTTAASEYMTGDGGAILVHGATGNDAPTVEIRHSVFESSQSYGNGGAISFSYDSSPKGRSYADPPAFEPTVLSGGCNALISDTYFLATKGGWQGGAISANGRGVHLSIQHSYFVNCRAGVTQLADGKAGAIAVCGGVQSPSSTQDDIALDACDIFGCSSSGNGGGIYVTIRGKLTLQNTSFVRECRADNQGQAERDLRQVEGLGGAIHCSAGGNVFLSDGSQLLNNSAASSGGGISVKTGAAKLTGTPTSPVAIKGNVAEGDDIYGNGGGVFVTTSYYDGPDPSHDTPGAAAAQLFISDGDLYSAGEGILIQNNTAARWGGGLYAGIPFSGSDSAYIDLNNAILDQNHAAGSVSDGGTMLLPSQIAIERVHDGWISATFSPSFQNSIITGNSSSTDIGIYCLHSLTPSSSGSTFGNVARTVLEQP